MINTLVVDDSVVFRTQIMGALSKSSEIKVVGTAPNGAIALQKLAQLSVDVVTLDMEMPDMNGIEVLREIRKRGFPVRVIIFSSQTQRGAESALLALQEGADDVVAKPSGENLSLESAGLAIQEVLIPKVLQFRKVGPAEENRTKPAAPVAEKVKASKRDLSKFLPSALVIGCSTGGPTALEKIFHGFTGPVAVPIFIVQHMPPVFTEILARRLSELSGIPASEAKSGEKVVANHIYVAPGDFHMVLDSTKNDVSLVLNQAPQRNSVRPAVDYLFESASSIYKSGCLAVVLTGMGEDGLVGAKAIRDMGGPVVIQDKESCVVFGMPGAIYAADEYDQMANLDSITLLLKRLIKS